MRGYSHKLENNFEQQNFLKWVKIENLFYKKHALYDVTKLLKTI